MKQDHYLDIHIHSLTHKNTQLHSFLILHLKKETYDSFHTYFLESALEKTSEEL